MGVPSHHAKHQLAKRLTLRFLHQTLDAFNRGNLDPDTIRQTVTGVVQGAETAETTYYSDGSVKVVKQMNGALIPKQLSPAMGNVFGQIYLGSPEVIEFANFEQMAMMMR